MKLDDAISLLRSHSKTDKAAAEYVGYTPVYYYTLLKAGESMPKKAKVNIIRAAELLESKETGQCSLRPELAGATARW